MAPPPRPPPPLIDDAVAEILLHLPPTEPEHLFRAALVCKPWLRILCDPGFLRRYRAFHGSPPLLGLVHRVKRHPGGRFSSTTSAPDFPYPTYDSDGRVALTRHLPLDCCHGRVLIGASRDAAAGYGYLVWDPVTRGRHAVPKLNIGTVCNAAVLCAADGCDHLHCRGGPFRVALLATTHDLVKASVYSSVTGAWSAPTSLDNTELYVLHMPRGMADASYYIKVPHLHPRRGTLIGDGIYFVVRRGNNSNTILKYDLGKNCLSIISPPLPNVDAIALMAMGSSLGFACIEGSSLYTWSRKVDLEGAAAEWVQCRAIELEATIPVTNPSIRPNVFGFAEGVGVILVSTDVGLFTVEHRSGKIKKIGEPGVYFCPIPYMSFYTPDRGRLLLLARDL